MKEIKAGLNVQVQPNSKRNEVTGLREGILHIRIAAPPVKGKANQELVKYLSGILGVPKSRVIVDKGAAGKRKRIEIIGLGQEQVEVIIKDLSAESKA
jgi:uncharacterized protein (TIGR00251 family)